MCPAAPCCQAGPLIAPLGGISTGRAFNGPTTPFQAAARAQADVCKGLISPWEGQGSVIPILYCLKPGLDTC